MMIPGHAEASGLVRVTNNILTVSKSYLAEAALKEWRFVPGREGDRAVDMWVTVPIRFALK